MTYYLTNESTRMFTRYGLYETNEHGDVSRVRYFFKLWVAKKYCNELVTQGHEVYGADQELA